MQLFNRTPSHTIVCHCVVILLNLKVVLVKKCAREIINLNLRAEDDEMQLRRKPLYKFGLFVGQSHLLLYCDPVTMTSRSYPSRHKAQQEEEDAAALKLGPGTSYCALISPSLISRLSLFPHPICRIQQRGLSSDFGGQVSAREQGQGRTRHGVRRSPAIQSFQSFR
jgi:hypothetical protein